MKTSSMGSRDRSPAFERIAAKIAERRCVILDGGVGTEIAQAAGAPTDLDERVWATRALVDAPDTVLDVHRSYIAAGCDVISTNTWGLATWRDGAVGRSNIGQAPVHWMDVARRALLMAHGAVEEDGRECAVAFSLNGEIDSPDGHDSVRLLTRLFAEGPSPDLILVETLSVVHPSLYETVIKLLGTGLPVWLSFRRCRHGLCGVFGEHWGGPEGDAFGRAAHAFEELGVGALLVNCVPPDHVDGMISYLRDFTDMPLGVYPNLGYFSDAGWRFDTGVDAQEYARMALRWRDEGAEIVGGCCGVRPEHIEAARVALEETKPGTERREGGVPTVVSASPDSEVVSSPWLDGRGRRLFPLELPKILVDDSVPAPDASSFLVWRHLQREVVGAHQRCIDVGCGAGLLAVQLALNGAEHVRAIDVSRAAVANTLTNAFRNSVDDRISGSAVDLYPWTPEERFDLIVANLDQIPTAPLAAAVSHRRTDYWGRGMLDQLVAKLPDALAPDGIALVVQLSFLSQQRTAALLGANGLEARVVDYSVFPLRVEEESRRRQIEHVEELSDAYHLCMGSHEAVVAYLLEITFVE